MRRRLVLCAASAAAVLAGGCSEKNAAPTAAFSVTCTDLRCTFTDASGDADGTVTSRFWSFGDAGTSADVNPVHTYPAPGTYRVTLTATDEDGATGSSFRDVTMNLPPRAAFSFVCSGLTCTMADDSIDVSGSIVSRSWTFGDGAVSVVQSPTHTYASAGTFSVTLTVVDDGGMSGTATRSISVTEPVGEPPQAAFVVTCNSLKCEFEDQSTDPDGIVTAWSWSFGDGTSSEVQNPEHTYDVASLTDMTVQLIVTDDDGATSVASKTFTVAPPAGLLCHDAEDTGELVSCTITLDRPARIEVELTDRECTARNAFTVTSPVVETLFDNGCYSPLELPAVWLLNSGNSFPAGTVMTAEMTSDLVRQEIPPSLVVSGTTSPWTIRFDDGFVAPPDLDLLITIRAIPDP